MAVVMTVLREDLQLPVVDPVQLFLYRSKASMAWYGHNWRTLPIDVERYTGFADGNKIHINLEGALPDNWGNFVRLLAHEYGHSIEAQLGARTHGGWFSEGFANWVSAKALHALGWEDYDSILERAKFEIIQNRPNPSLGELTWDWKPLLQSSRGYAKTYSLAFVAVDRLINRGGIEATLKYIESGHFEKSFKFSWEDFQSDFSRYLSNLETRDRTDSVLLKKPIWKLGDEWSYQVKAGKADLFEVNRVLREDEFDGKASYVVKADDVELFVAKETLSRLAVRQNGKILTKYDFLQQFSWPISVGRRWTGALVRENAVTKKKRKINLTIIVAKAENVSVLAGTFNAVRIQAYDSNNGRLMMEYWYAPATKWIVKSIEYFEVPFRRKELKSFRVNRDAK